MAFDTERAVVSGRATEVLAASRGEGVDGGPGIYSRGSSTRSARSGGARRQRARPRPPPGAYGLPRVSGDGRRLLLEGSRTLEALDFERGTRTRIAGGRSAGLRGARGVGGWRPTAAAVGVHCRARQSRYAGGPSRSLVTVRIAGASVFVGGSRLSRPVQGGLRGAGRLPVARRRPRSTGARPRGLAGFPRAAAPGGAVEPRRPRDLLPRRGTGDGGGDLHGGREGRVVSWGVGG